MEEKEKDLNNEVVEVHVDATKLDDAATRIAESATKLAESAEAITKANEDAKIPGAYGTQFSEKDNKDAEKFSYRKLVMQSLEKKLDGLELEMHQEGLKEAKESGIQSDELAVAVPTIIHSRATLQATVDAAGGYAVAEDTLGLIPTLRNKMAVGRAGATIMGGLKGDVKFPKRTSDSAATWRSEGGTATQSDAAYGSVSMSPNRLTAYSVFSRQFLRQSSFDVEAEVRDSLMYGHLNALETAVFTGSGTSNQPTGLFNQTINDGDHGSNGTVLNWANILQLERMVAEDNALMENLAYITNATAAGAMKRTTKESAGYNGYIWEMMTPLTDGMVNGYNAYITNAISNAGTRGTGTALSAVVFGNWKELLIGQWGPIEFIVNPYSRDIYDEIRVTGLGYFDLAVRHPESFAAIEGLETS